MTTTPEQKGDGTDGTKQPPAQDKMYAGKYKTVEELEEGYKNSARVYEANRDLEAKLKDATSIPDDYQLPEGVTIDEVELKEIKFLAKESGLTQSHFNKVATQLSSKAQTQKAALDKAVNDLGTEKVNVLKSYVEKYYPEGVTDVVLNKLITDEKARTNAFAHREKLLNSSAPGIGTVPMSTEEKVSQEQINEARIAMEKKYSKEARDKYTIRH